MAPSASARNPTARPPITSGANRRDDRPASHGSAGRSGGTAVDDELGADVDEPAGGTELDGGSAELSLVGHGTAHGTADQRGQSEQDGGCGGDAPGTGTGCVVRRLQVDPGRWGLLPFVARVGCRPASGSMRAGGRRVGLVLPG